MKGVIKLKVPATPKKPKLFVITLLYNGQQRKFSQVAYDLVYAIGKCWYGNHQYTIHEYICHTELSVDEINSLFKNFTP